METEVKYCPFGCPSNLDMRTKPYFRVECLECGAEGPVADDADSAIKRWNIRKPQEEKS